MTARIACNNTDCAAMEGHVPACPLSALPSPIALAEMSAEELAVLKEQFKSEAMKSAMPILLPEREDDERFVLSFDLDKLPTPQALDIVQRLLPEWVTKFLESNYKYREVGNDLGYRGVLPDVNRKYGILKARVWEGKPEEEHGREPTRGVILDLIGHLFLMLHMLDDEEGLSVQSVQERAKAMAKHPAGKGRPHPLSEGASRQGLCKEGYAFDDENVLCFREQSHQAASHFGRKKDGTPVRWDKGGLIP